MTTFDKRERGFEAQFAHEEEVRFKASARRNRLAGLWAAEKLGLTGSDAETYAKAIVMTEVDKPGSPASGFRTSAPLTHNAMICNQCTRVIQTSSG